MSLQIKSFNFGEFCLEVKENILLRQGKPVALTPKALKLLFLLVENHGQIVEREDLMQKVWADSFVEESNLTFTVSLLRKVLNDDKQGSRFIETIPKRGYRFVAEVKELPEINQVEPQNFSLSEKKHSSGTASQFKRFFIPAISFGVLLICTVAFNSWYQQGFKNKFPILSAPFSSEKLSTDGKVMLAVISSDGKNIVYQNENGRKQSIWIRQIELATNTELIPPSEDRYFGLSFSPDANFIYFVRKPRQNAGQSDIYRTSIFGGIPTKIINETQGWTSISPDGKKISFVRCYYKLDENCSLYIADALDGKNERKIVSRPSPFRIGDNQISPDGKSIAFAVGQSVNQSNEFGLNEVNIETGAEHELTKQKFFNIRSLEWLPDEKDLLISASRIPNRNYRIWQVSPETDEAVPLTKDSEDYSDLSLDKSAALITATQTKADFKLAVFNKENPADKRILFDANTVKFAPDGKIFFSSSMSGNEEIWSVNADGSGKKQLTNDVADDSDPISSPDGNSLFFSSNRTGAAQVWRMNADGSNQVQITKAEGGFPLAVTPDGRWVYYLNGIRRTLWRASTKGDNEQLVLDKGKYRFAISPDGLQVAYSEKQEKNSVLTIVSLADGKTVKSFPLPINEAKITEIEWLPDGKALTYILSDGAYENNTLWLQTTEQGAPAQIAGLGDKHFNSLTLSPDGKSFAAIEGNWNFDAVLLRGLK